MKRSERWCVAGLLALGAALGTWSALEATRLGVRQSLFDFSYGPAVMLACGRGFVNPASGQSPELDAFLQTRVDAFACDRLPATVSTVPLLGYQRTFRYLMWTIAAFWWAGGVSWIALSYLSGLMMGLTAALSYGVLRLVARPAIALAGALIVLTSPLHVNYITDLRNYPKAPLMLGLGLLLGLLLQGGTPKRMAALALGLGALLGAGMGFRQDLLVFVPLVVVALVTLWPGPWARSVRPRLGAVAVTMAAAVVAAAPVLAAYAPGGGASTSHVATLGLMSPFDAPLGVSNGSLYEWGYYNEDSFAYATLAGHGRRVLGLDQPMPVYGEAYDAASASYLSRIVTTFPGDLLTRIYASAIRLIELPSSTPFSAVPIALDGSPIAWFWRWRGAALAWTSGLWAAAALAALAWVATSSLWRALVLAGLIIYTLGYPAIQFHERHYFALDIVPLAAAAFLLEQIVGLGRGASRTTPTADGIRALAFLAALMVMTLVPLATARAYQAAEVRDLFLGYLSAPTTRVQVSEHRGADGLVMIAPLIENGDGLPGPGRTRTDVYLIGLGGDTCDVFAVDLTVKYQRSHANPDFTHTKRVRLGMLPHRTRLVLPVFAYRSDAPDGQPVVTYRFDGFAVPEEQRSCVDSFERVTDPAAFPLAVTAVLPEAWEQATLYQTLTEWESRTAVVPNTYLAPADAPRPARSLRTRMTPFVELGTPRTADVVHVAANGQWTVNGRGGLDGRGGMFYLAHLAGVPLRAGQTFVAEGVLYTGGLSLGLVREGVWIGQVAVRDRGPFVAAVTVADTARYDLVVANNLPRLLGKNQFSITRIGVTD